MMKDKNEKNDIKCFICKHEIGKGDMITKVNGKLVHLLCATFIDEWKKRWKKDGRKKDRR